MISFTKTKLRHMCAEIRLLNLFDQYSKENFALDFKFQDYADSVNVSYSTLKNYLKAFRDAGILKFSYKKQIIVLNPDIFIARADIPENVLLFARGGFENFAGD